MRVLLASANPGKLVELRAHFAGSALNLALPPGGPPRTEETGTTYRENALRKARALAAASGGWALADDSGLEVDALGGAPGVRSARYAGEGAPDAAHVAKLLAALHGARDRTARFRCVLALVSPGGEAVVADGAVEGAIAAAPRGGAGFGYDPVFVPAGDARTFAELDPQAKRRVSHRARAAAALLAALPPLPPG